MAQYRQIVADEVLKAAANTYSSEYDSYVSQNRDKAEKELKDRFEQIQKEIKDIQKRNENRAATNKAACNMRAHKTATNFNHMSDRNRASIMKKNKGGYARYVKLENIGGYGNRDNKVGIALQDVNKYMSDASVEYNENDGSCKVTTTKYTCSDYKADTGWCDGYYTASPTSTTETVPAKSPFEPDPTKSANNSTSGSSTATTTGGSSTTKKPVTVTPVVNVNLSNAVATTAVAATVTK